jgi:2,4-dienoyl-CoA reductase-like NADH-dependent reductase (Old Yellow Enzyme family)
MSFLFEPFKIGSLSIKNRFIRSATTSYWSDRRGIVGPEIIDLYRRLAKGGVGLIIKGHLYVKDSGKAHLGMAGISEDYHVPSLRELTDEVHKNNGKIIAQLNYAGIYGVVDKAGPSECVIEDCKVRALSPEEIHDIVDAFGEGAARALDAGFDGVQIHGAHGYLVSQFLSRVANKRTDEWGGKLENRMRLLLEVYDAIRARVGDRTPIMLKINCDDFSPNGFTIKDSARVAEVMSRRGLQAIEVSGGGIGRREDLRARARSLDPELLEASFAGHATEIRKVTRPTSMALVNGIRSLKCMKDLVSKDVTDLISMSRPFIREPDLVERLESGQEASTCNSCNICRSNEVFGKMMLRCHSDQKEHTSRDKSQQS